MAQEVHIWERLKMLRNRAAVTYKISKDKCHVGHLVLEGLLDNPEEISQIDAATDQKETFISVRNRSSRLASAMKNSGLQIGNCVVIMGYGHMDLVLPFYACHFNGYSVCAIDPSTDPRELASLFEFTQPVMAFSAKVTEENIKEAFRKNKLKENIVCYDDGDNNIETFIRTHKGTEVDFRPAEFDQSKVNAWYMLTSGTTGQLKLVVVTFETLFNGVGCWWEKFTGHIDTVLALATIQWMSSLFYYLSGPLRNYTRLQSSVALNPALLVKLINVYKPNVAVFTPHVMHQFLNVSQDVCDLSCFKYVGIGGSAIEKSLVDRFKERCKAYCYLVYGMTELVIPVFDFVDNTPFGSTGLPFKKFQYRIVDDDGNILEKPFESGELWIKGDGFFKGYLNNPEETRAVLTEDGWVKTGDIFYRDEQDFFYFTDRKRMLIKYTGLWISPLMLEEVIKRHPGVNEVCVVGIPDREKMELPVAAIVKKNGSIIEPQEIFDLIKDALPEIRRLHGGFFYLDALPETPSGKVHRAKLSEVAMKTPRITPQS